MTTGDYRRKEHPRPEKKEKSADWLKRKEQTRNERGQSTSTEKLGEKPMDLDLSFVSEEEDQCYNKINSNPAPPLTINYNHCRKRQT